MRVLVTGADGFVGNHLCRHLRQAGDEVIELRGMSVDGSACVDIRDAAAVHRAVAEAQADAMIHLAGASSVARSHEQPAQTFMVNAIGTVNLLEAARACAPRMRVVHVGSGEVYGALPRGERATEQWPFAPVSPYASSKAAAEIAALQFHRSYGLHVVCARPFNHLGAGQSPNFLVPDVARQIDEIRRGARPPRIVLGNVEVVRDFSHVSDVARAYCLLVHEGQPGEAYNICSGEARTIRSVVEEMVALSGVTAEIVIAEERKRAAELEVLVGDCTKLRKLGWAPRLTVADALRDALDEARSPS